jgi:DNA primase
MARFSQQFIQQVLQATDIVDLIGRYVALKQKGREFAGLCPFHDDSRPSMFVSPSKQIYKCFACGAGGNALTFVTEYEKLPFPEAVRKLAEQANIPLPKDYAPEAPDGLGKADLTKLTELACGFFRSQLASPAGADALAYAKQRGLSDESIERFSLGYAPNEWEAFSRFARRKGFSEQQLVAAGLAKRRDRGQGCYDTFRHRLMFPIHDLTGRVIAFGGRALDPEERAKYLNSPESTLFDKSSLVYGLPFAREAIVRARQAVVVEGYLDVLLPHQEGVDTLVATLGTALTERHVRLLNRYVEGVVLLFDADTAGAAAAERALELFLAQRVHVRVATIPAGKDPADYVLAEGAEALQQLIDAAPDAMEYVWQQRYAAWQEAGANPSQRGRVIEDFLRLVVTSSAYGAIDETRRSMLAQHIAHVVHVPELDLQRQMRQMQRKLQPASAARPDEPIPAGAPQRTGPGVNPERVVLEVLLDEPELFDDAAERIDPAMFGDAMLRALAERVWALGLEDRLSMDELLGDEQLASAARLVTDLAWQGQQRGNHRASLTDAIQRILERQERGRLSKLKSNLDDDQALRTLQEKLSQNAREGRNRFRNSGLGR